MSPRALLVVEVATLLAGLALVVLGVALWSGPLALVVAGAALIALALWPTPRDPGRHETR